MKLWIKIIRNEKIIKDTVTEGNAENAKELHALLADVCDRLNCPVPLVTTCLLYTSPSPRDRG